MLFSRLHRISALFFLMLPAAVQAQFQLSTNNGAITIVHYTGTSAAPVIPSATNGYPVVSIGNLAFEDSSVTNVTIPDSVTNIGMDAFFSCTNLTSVAIPGSVTEIGLDAFAECSSLAGVAISNGVAGIGGFAFYECSSLTNVTIPGSVATVENNVFGKCTSLAAVTISNGVTGIQGDAFDGCVSLTSITIPNSVTNIEDFAFLACSNLSSTYFLGNAPPDHGNAFSGDPATVYYLPGTYGWTATFGGVPVVLWNPQAMAFTKAAGQFGFSITGPTNAAIVVEACTNLANPIWLPMSTNVLSSGGLSSFSDLLWTNYPNRYYRFTAP